MNYRSTEWLTLSYRFRESKDWRCEECGIFLKNDREMLHTHHTRGKQYNDFADLKALCIACHAKQPGGYHHLLKQRRTYKRFMEKYGKHWQASRKGENPCETDYR